MCKVNKVFLSLTIFFMHYMNKFLCILAEKEHYVNKTFYKNNFLDIFHYAFCIFDLKIKYFS